MSDDLVDYEAVSRAQAVALDILAQSDVSPEAKNATFKAIRLVFEKASLSLTSAIDIESQTASKPLDSNFEVGEGASDEDYDIAEALAVNFVGLKMKSDMRRDSLRKDTLIVAACVAFEAAKASIGITQLLEVQELAGIDILRNALTTKLNRLKKLEYLTWHSTNDIRLTDGGRARLKEIRAGLLIAKELEVVDAAVQTVLSRYTD